MSDTRKSIADPRPAWLPGGGAGGDRLSGTWARLSQRCHRVGQRYPTWRRLLGACASAVLVVGTGADDQHGVGSGCGAIVLQPAGGHPGRGDHGAGRPAFVRPAGPGDRAVARQGKVGGGVPVPAPGQSIGNHVLTTGGSFSIEATTSPDGVLTVRRSAALAQADDTEPAVSAACNETAYNFEGPVWLDVYGRPITLKWYYSESTASRAGLTVSASESAIRQGNVNLTLGYNDCGYTGAFRSVGAFQGNTARYANINSAGSCTTRFPDGQNTTSFGPFDSGGTLAVTCYSWAVRNGAWLVFTEADTYFGSNVGLRPSLPANCSGVWDLQGVATHEWGHAFGMAHETSGSHETMYPALGPCSTGWRTLGNGDWHGMRQLYGMR